MVPQVFSLKKKHPVFEENRFSIYGQLSCYKKNFHSYLFYSYQIIKPFYADNILFYLIYVKNTVK